jgi:hypothetical protein
MEPTEPAVIGTSFWATYSRWPGDASTSIIEQGVGFTVNVAFQITGAGALVLGGTFNIQVWFEGYGTAPDVTLPSVPVNVRTGALVLVPPSRTYNVGIPVAGGTLPAGVYRMTVVITRQNAGVPGPIAGFSDDQIVQIFPGPQEGPELQIATPFADRSPMEDVDPYLLEARRVGRLTDREARELGELVSDYPNTGVGNLRTCLRSVTELLSLKRGWNSYSAKPLAPQNAIRAMRLLRELLGPETPAPAVVPRVQGGIHLEWHTGNVDIAIYIDSPDEVRFFAGDTASGKSAEGPLIGHEDELKVWVQRIPGK